MYLAYRYFRNKRRARQNAQNQGGDGEAPVQQDGIIPFQETPDSTVVATVQPTQQEKSSNNKYMMLLMVGLAIPVFLETLDYTVVATGQVHIASFFNRLDLQSYIGTVYLLTSTVFLPLFASISDVFGRHLSLQISLVFFMVGSAISTGSENMPTMLAGRGIAGVGAAGLLAAVRIILTDSSSLNTNNWQQSMLFILYSLGYCAGPWIGGELLRVSFRWIFAINLPFCALAMTAAFFALRGRVRGSIYDTPTLPSSADDPAPATKLTWLEKLFHVDWIGAALFMGGGILILLALNWGSTEKWHSAKVIVSFVIGGLLIVAFLAWQYILERKKDSIQASSPLNKIFTDPMIPLELFKDPNVAIVMYGTFVGGAVMIVMFYFVAIFMTIVSGLPPQKSGVQLLYFAPGLGVGGILAITFVRIWRQPKYPAMLGGVVGTVALGLVAMAMQNNNQPQIDGFLAMAGAGVGLTIGPFAIHARFSQPEERVAIVSALSLFFRAFGGTVGLAQCGAVLNSKVTTYLSHLVASGALSASDAAALLSTASLSSLQGIDNLPADVQTAVRAAFREGTKWCFISLVPWAGLSAILTFFLSNIPDSDTRRQAALAQAAEKAAEKVPAQNPENGENMTPEEKNENAIQMKDLNESGRVEG